MRQLYYTIRYLLRGRGRNVIKVLSLTLGLGLGMGLIQFGAYISWGTDDSYLGYIHLRPGVFSESINRKISVLLPKYIDVEREKKQGYYIKLYIKPVSEIYTQSTEVKRMVVIMSVQAFALLLVAAMNMKSWNIVKENLVCSIKNE